MTRHEEPNATARIVTFLDHTDQIMRSNYREGFHEFEALVDCGTCGHRARFKWREVSDIELITMAKFPVRLSSEHVDYVMRSSQVACERCKTPLVIGKIVWP